MSRPRSRKFFFVSSLVAIGVLALSVAVVVARVSGRSAPRPSTEEAAVGPTGSVRLALNLPGDSKLDAVGYVVQSAKNVVIARGSLPVPAPPTAVLTQDVVLPVGQGARVSFVGSTRVDGVPRATFLGQKTFDVTAGQATEVQLTSGGAAGAGPLVDGASRSGASGASAITGKALTCQSCQLSSAQPLCDPPNLTATSNMHPQTGEQTGIGWGCGTLATEPARKACLALFQCLSATDCEQGGQNPVMGCYCGTASAVPCLAGDGVNGPCLSLYHAAAAASPEGPPEGATGPQLSRFIAIAASDPTTPIGLADNLRKCAIDSHCQVCDEL